MVTQIIIINYKTWQDTIACLGSLLLLTSRKIRISIVEMCNLNDSRRHLKNWIEDHPEVATEIIEINQNLGFAGANNAAMQKVLSGNKPDFIWLLNNDTVVDNAALDDLVKTWHLLENDQKAPAFIGSKIIDFDRRETIQSVGGSFNPLTGISKLTGMGSKIERFPANGILPTDYVMGASMFFHSNLIRSIGLMDSAYFLYYEDVDWCYKAKAHGYRNFTCLSSRVFHKQGATTGNKYDKTAFDPATIKYLHSSYLRFFSKHFPMYLPVALVMILKQIMGRIFRRHFSEAGILTGVLFTSPKIFFSSFRMNNSGWLPFKNKSNFNLKEV